MKTKRYLILALCLILCGMVIFAVTMSCIGWDFTKISIFRTIEKEYSVTNEFTSVKIIDSSVDVTVLPSDNGMAYVVSSTQENIDYNVCVKDNILTVESVDNRPWYDMIFSGKSTLTVYVPVGDYEQISVDLRTGDLEIKGDLSFNRVTVESSTGDTRLSIPSAKDVNIKTSTGNVRIDECTSSLIAVFVSTGKVYISDVICDGDIVIAVSTGDTEVENVTCTNFSSNGTTGDLYLENVIASLNFNIVRDTGDVRFDCCDASEIKVKTTTGNVSGSLLSEKVFLIDHSTGKVDVPECVTGGKCSIETTTGDIEIVISK